MIEFTSFEFAKRSERPRDSVGPQFLRAGRSPESVFTPVWQRTTLKFGAACVEQGPTYYEERYKERLLHNLTKRAKELGFTHAFQLNGIQFLRSAPRTPAGP
jgi:hypothetical protein